MPRPLAIGLVLGLLEDVPTGDPPRWTAIRESALGAEAAGFDTVWIPDELLWSPDSWPGPRGWWECVAVTAAVAEATERIKVGTWVLSALHRNAALSAKIASTLDEISGGRLIFGFGAGHSARQGEAFGYPPDLVVGRYEEALEILVPLLRDGRVTFEGEHHRADLVNRPPGPRPGTIPILLGGHGPRTIRLAVRHADIWNGYATQGSRPTDFADVLALVDRICEEQGREPSTIGRSLGVEVVSEGLDPSDWGLTEPLAGPAEAIAEAFAQFAQLGVTSLEVMAYPMGSPATIEAVVEAMELLET